MRFLVRGGRPLSGTVPVGSAKNALLPELAAALLTEEQVTIGPAAGMRDVDAMVELLRGVGAEVRMEPGAGGAAIRVRAVGPLAPDAPDEAVGRMRASILVLGPLLVRGGRARLAAPGGCAIGTRPIDLHLRAMAALGARVREAGGRVEVSAPNGLRGGEIALPYPSHTATENALLAACGARGPTVITGAAMEPEIADLAALLQAMGADVRGAGTPVLRVHPPARLRGASHRPIPDRIEAGTLLLAGAIAGRGTVTVAGALSAHLGAVIAKLRSAGCAVEVGAAGISVRSGTEGARAVDVRTQPFPGFPTDLQPQFTVLAALARGRTLVEETVFDNRLGHLAALAAMGARVRRYGSRFAWIEGPARLRPAAVAAADLRGGAALVLAGLAAAGETVVAGGEHVARGYADLDGKLRVLGADIGVAAGDDAVLPSAGQDARLAAEPAGAAAR